MAGPGRPVRQLCLLEVGRLLPGPDRPLGLRVRLAAAVLLRPGSARGRDRPDSPGLVRLAHDDLSRAAASDDPAESARRPPRGLPALAAEPVAGPGGGPDRLRPGRPTPPQRKARLPVADACP